MKYFLIAGEASGDLHGAHIVTALLKSDPEAQIRCWGGDKMQAAGAQVLKHIRELAFMGFIEVVRNLPQILRNFKLIKKQIQAFDPDIVLFIDYPGFNLRMAEWTHKNGIRNAYYIAPQVWAWKENRIHKMRKYIDRLYVILPFEKKYFESHKINTKYVGHPLLEGIPEEPLHGRQKQHDGITLALLPGSRKQEIQKMLPVMLQSLKSFPEVRAIIAGAPNIECRFYERWTQNNPRISLMENKTYDLLAKADYALVTSGTATLETALFKVPQIVLYKGNWLSYRIAKSFVKVKYISLVNLILDRPVLPELIQAKVTPAKIAKQLQELMTPEKTQQQLDAFQNLRILLDEGGSSGLVVSDIRNSLRSA